MLKSEARCPNTLLLCLCALVLPGSLAAQTPLNGPVVINGGPDALTWNGGQSRLTNTSDTIIWNRNTFSFLLDSDNSQNGGSFRVYNDVVSSSGAQPVVHFSMDATDSWINHTGDFGIGTTSPQAKLDVTGDGRFNGTITAKEVVVTQDGWPDFVFEEEYQLMPLEELEATIRAAGHLPGIPSAGEVTQQGVHLGEMQAMLLLKIEELTLYMIELKEENKQLTSRIVSIEALSMPQRCAGEEQ